MSDPERWTVEPVPCPACGAGMTDHYRESLGTAAYYVDRECEHCGYWDHDEDGGF